MKRKKGEEVHWAGGEGQRQGGRGGSYIAPYHKGDSVHRMYGNLCKQWYYRQFDSTRFPYFIS